jgi:valyl-tRNA synthetase
MEANEAQELQEQAEHAEHESALRPVAFTMSLLAVLVAVTTVLGHRTHTEAIIEQTRAAVEQNRATDMWGFYQAKNIRNTVTGLNGNLLTVLSVADKKSAEKLKADYEKKQKKWEEDLKEAEAQAHEHEAKVKECEAAVTAAEERANRFDFSEALLEIGLVITSVTLLTRRRIYWYLGIVASAAGILSALSVLLLK